MKKKLVVVISIGMILICGSVFAITAVVNSNYEKESIEKSSKVINNNVEENLDSIYSKSDTEVIINNLESENLGGTGTSTPINSLEQVRLSNACAAKSPMTEKELLRNVPPSCIT